MDEIHLVESESKVPDYSEIAKVYDDRRKMWPVLSSIITLKEDFESKLSASQDIIEELQKENALLRRQVKKTNIYKFLEGITDHKISHKALVDIQLQGDTIMLGRPNVEGSSKKQMRHVTPYSFITTLIEVQTQEVESANTLYANLKDLVPILVHEKAGICLRDIDVENISKILRKHSRDNYKILTTAKNFEQRGYILIKKDDLVPTWGTKLFKMGYAEEKIEESESLYHEKRIKYIQYGLDLIAKNISPDDDNTYNITCEVLARLILTLFNERSLAAFPDEGNSLNYEIRLYETSDSAKDAASEDYEIIKSNAVRKLIEDEENLNLRIRIVNNEGSLVQKFVQMLKLLNNILKDVGAYYQLIKEPELNEEQEQRKDDLYSKIEQTIGWYNSQRTLFIKRTLKSVKIEAMDEKDNEIDEPAFSKNMIDILRCYPNDVANMLYLIFDFKPLESEVFVPSNQKNAIKVYPSAEDLEIATYGIQFGDEYRKAQINSVKKGDYNKKVKFRTNLSFQEEIKILTDKIIEHLTIVLVVFEYFKDKSNLIKDRFVEQVKNDYKVNYSLDQQEQFDKVFDEYFQKAFTETANLGFFDNFDDVKSSGSEAIDIDNYLE
jgi:hypothetical protein